MSKSLAVILAIAGTVAIMFILSHSMLGGSWFGNHGGGRHNGHSFYELNNF